MLRIPLRPDAHGHMRRAVVYLSRGGCTVQVRFDGIGWVDANDQATDSADAADIRAAAELLQSVASKLAV